MQPPPQGYTIGADGEQAPAPANEKSGWALGKIVLVGAVSAFTGAILIRLFDRATTRDEEEDDELAELRGQVAALSQQRDAAAMLAMQAAPPAGPPFQGPAPSAGSDQLWTKMRNQRGY
jgi:hypothetical protein